MRLKPYLYALCLGLLSACAAPPVKAPRADGVCVAETADTKQVIAISTQPDSASCTLSNDKGSWTISATPGSVNIRRSAASLSIVCHAAGYLETSEIIKPELHDKGVFDWLKSLFSDSAQPVLDNSAQYEYPVIAQISLPQVIAPAKTVPAPIDAQ